MEIMTFIKSMNIFADMTSSDILVCVIVGIIALVVGLIIAFPVGVAYRRKVAEAELGSAEEEARRIVNESIKTAESRKKEALIEAKDEIHRLRSEADKEIKDRRAEVQRSEHRLQQKEESLEKKADNLDKKEEVMQEKIQAAEARLAEAEQIKKSQFEMLERISGYSEEQAKIQLLEEVEAKLSHEKALRIMQFEQQLKDESEEKAREIIGTAVSRCAPDYVAEATVSVVPLPSDEMKGRIIGREGRNIRTLETMTGVDIIIDDTPEAVVISCFDPVRKEIAKVALERLISDGRIHPTRIEEIVQKVTREIQQKIYEEGEKALFELGIHNMNTDGVIALGRLYFRTSYGQNVLTHSKEVALIAALLAAELGGNREIAKRAALLHDIGKGAENETEQNHAEVGADMARKMGEDQVIINAIAAHHNDVEPQSLEAVLVQIADAISAARPGARRETVDNYVKRLENLEAVAENFNGVEKAYAIQAGRELRILVNNEKVSEEDVKELARSIAKLIESDLKYPGRIKLTMIRETRLVEYAR